MFTFLDLARAIIISLIAVIRSIFDAVSLGFSLRSRLIISTLLRGRLISITSLFLALFRLFLLPMGLVSILSRLGLRVHSCRVSELGQIYWDFLVVFLHILLKILA